MTQERTPNLSSQPDLSSKRRRLANSEKHYVEPIAVVDLSEVRSDFRGRKSVKLRDMKIVVSIPYDIDMNKLFRKVGGKPNDKHEWEFHISKHYALKPYLDELEILHLAGWRDRVISTGREELGDLRIWVKAEHIEDYEEGYLIFHAEKEWIVTHIARPVYFRDTGLKHPVYLMEHKLEELKITEARGFD